MEDLKKQKAILEAIKEAVANIKLDEDFNDIIVTDKLIEEINKKVKMLVM